MCCYATTCSSTALAASSFRSSASRPSICAWWRCIWHKRASRAKEVERGFECDNRRRAWNSRRASRIACAGVLGEALAVGYFDSIYAGDRGDLWLGLSTADDGTGPHSFPAPGQREHYKYKGIY